MKHTFFLILFFLFVDLSKARILEVGIGREFSRLQTAAAAAIAGDTILIREGKYSGGDYVENLHGTPDAWITICAAENENVLFEGNSQAFHLTDPAYVRIEGLLFLDQTGNGVNIDDGGTPETPAHHVIIRNCTWLGMNATGNNDELKLSGLDDFSIIECDFRDGSAGGSLVDMVGCHRGVFEANTFTNGGSNCIQAKGATKDITIIRNRFTNGGQRSINIGGSTGLAFFRPLGTLYEASDIFVYSNIFEGSVAPIAFVGAVNCEVINNTIIRPERWAIRILQETTEPGFLPCGNNTFQNNIIVFTSVQPAINIGGNTAPQTFTFSNNLWYNPDNSTWSGPNTPVSETGSLINIDPLLNDTLTVLPPNSPAVGKGISRSKPSNDFNNTLFAEPRSMGAVEGASSLSVTHQRNTSPFQVFPNPAHDKLTVINRGSSTELKLVDMKGKVVWKEEVENEVILDIRSLRAGCYFLRPDVGRQLVIIQ